jgi:periplasmic divalent cation tolerance protein
MPPDVCVVLVTAPNSEVAASLGRALLDERLIACANLVPGVRSIYRWKGELCDEAEVLLVLKARSSDFEALRARIVALHPYEVPEVLRLDAVAGHHPWVDWLLASTAR